MDEELRSVRFFGEEWFREKVDKRVRQSLADKHACYAREHRDSTDEELLDYVRLCAAQLGKTPHAGEVIGGLYISSRFGSWEQVLRILGMEPAGTIPQLRNRQIYKVEYKHQAKLLRQACREEKNARTMQRKERMRKASNDQKTQRARDLLWGEEHAQDTDEQLLDHVRACAAQLGRTPVIKDVTGAYYICERFGSWSLMLTCAGLPLPPGMDPPRQKLLDAYRRKRQEHRCKDNPLDG